MTKSDIERSHSKWANFKLTLLCFFALSSISLVWIGLGMIEKYLLYGGIALGVGTAFTLMSLWLIKRFVK